MFELSDPGVHRGRDVGIFGNEVTGAAEPVDLRSGQPRCEVTQIQIGEDRVRGPPEKQRRHFGELV